VHIRIVPHLESSRSLVFDVIERDLRDGVMLKIGRFSDRFLPPNRITFRSKVVSRGHAELWIENAKIYIRDTGSSSGTFLNHVRLSAPGQQSKPCELRDGDVVQLGMDYKGGHEDIYRAVKMRFEFNRNQQQTNNYSINTFQSLRNLITPPNNIKNARIEDCCICLYAIAPFQALFVAPCSHTFHFKCCRPLLQNFPGFQCPICRSYANLDASVAIEASEV
ncbi:SMAD/FHA domain-containing protein, partial [Dichotomocladium elegans]